MTSFRARWCLGILVAGYLAMAAVAGAPNSPLTVLLPTGAGPPSWSTDLAGAVDLDRVGRSGLIAVSWIPTQGGLVTVAAVGGAIFGRA